VSTFKKQLLTTTIACGSLVLLPGQALAQDASNAPVTPVTGQATTGQPAQTSAPDEGTGPEPGAPAPAPVTNSAQESSGDEIVVTGTLIPRRTTSETPSPVTVLSQESMDQRGVKTVGDALQRLT
jgi:outer membrane receptor for ferric coprogen and ferric-rhodotorulic acid